MDDLDLVIALTVSRELTATAVSTILPGLAFIMNPATRLFRIMVTANDQNNIMEAAALDLFKRIESSEFPADSVSRHLL